MSKHHQSSRRKSYGRRQHELRERTDRRHAPDRVELTWDEPSDSSPMDSFSFLESRSPGLRLAFGD